MTISIFALKGKLNGKNLTIAFLFLSGIYTMFMLHLHCLRESGNVTSYAAETCFMRGKQQVST